MDFSLSDDQLADWLAEQTLVGREFLAQGFAYWTTDDGPQRSPFPQYMREELEELAVRLFLDRAAQIEDPDAIDDAALSELFTEAIFDVGLHLARTDDDRLTIRYPDFPRVGDTVNRHRDGEASRRAEVMRRRVDEAEGLLVIEARFLDTGEAWETMFPLDP